jgi:HPt (histidine-containing phosphotransfer) domain-containing protein
MEGFNMEIQLDKLEIIEIDKLKNAFKNKRDGLLISICEIYQKTKEEKVLKIRSCVQDKNYSGLFSAAHDLKSGISYFYATKVIKLLQELEDQHLKPSDKNSMELLAEFEAALIVLDRDIQTILKAVRPTAEAA